MKYLLRSTNEILLTEEDIRRKFENVSLPASLTTETLSSLGIDIVKVGAPPVANIIQEVVETAPTLGQDGNIWQRWQTVDSRVGKTEAELAELLGRVVNHKKEEITFIRNSMLVSGYKYDFTGFGVKTLQTRSDSDMVNWLGLAQESALAALEGRDQEYLGIITEDNTAVVVTYAECLVIMRLMAGWRAQIIFHSRTLKDQIDAAIVGIEPYSAIDIVMEFNVNEGWPT